MDRTNALVAMAMAVTIVLSSFVVSWPTFFLMCGISNVLQSAAHFILLGGEAAKVRPPLGWMPEGPPDYGRAACNLHGDANSIWIFVGVAGVAYGSHGILGWMGFWWLTIWGLLKWLTAAMCLKIIFKGRPGWAAAPTVLMEIGLGAMFIGRAWSAYGPLDLIR